MSTRTLSAFVARVRTLAHSEPNPDAREAYRHVLDMLGRIDTGDAADVIAATAPPPQLHGLPQDWPIVCDGMDADEQDELRRSMIPDSEAEVA